MKTRIITGAVGGVSAIAIFLFVPTLGIRVLAALICLLAMYELLQSCGCKHKGVWTSALIFAASCSFLDWPCDVPLLWIALVTYGLLLALNMIFSYDSLPFEQVVYIAFASIFVVMPIASLAYIRAIPVHGTAFLFLPLIIAWFSDMGAYFAGSFLGKHKLCEKISPKKTVEGFIGGIVAAVAFSLLGAWMYQMVSLDGAGLQVQYGWIALIALVTAPISVVGDLFCSVIKRRQGIKDFGNLFPGHGGVLDRFDSLIFVSPILHVLCSQLPLIQ